MALAQRGVVALAIDMPCFGDRADETETSFSKRLHWEGRTLFGRMLEDLGGAARWLSALEGVDPDRIGVFGFSMGATHAFWLGALEPAIARVAHACSFADLGKLISAGAHDLHGPYMTVARPDAPYADWRNRRALRSATATGAHGRAGSLDACGCAGTGRRRSAAGL